MTPCIRNGGKKLTFYITPMPVFREGEFLSSVFQIIKLVKDRVRNKI